MSATDPSRSHDRHDRWARAVPRIRRLARAPGRVLLALLPPLVTVVVQYALWPILQPFAWFLFYPAVFVSSWIGGLRGGLLATAVATGLVWWFFIPPEHVLVKAEARYLVSAAAFAITGALFSLLQSRLTAATRSATQAHDELRALNAELEQRVAARTTELRAAREREAETAGRIQQMLLLDEPPRNLRGLQIAALTVPSQRIAGDFYGFFHHEATDCLDVLIADVMGTGVLAALVGAAAKSQFPHALWNLMAESPAGAVPEPRDIVTLAHTSMARRLIGLESFVTACYARFDAANRTVTIVDCGHTGVVHFRRADGHCTIVHGDNLPLGVRAGEIYDQVTVRYEVGDILLLFSDGVTEARNPRGEQFGPDRLIACVRRHADAEPAALVSAVRDAAQAFAGPRALADDLTCVVVQVTPHPVPLARAELEIHSELGELRRVRELVAGFCRDRMSPPLDETALAALVLAVDEAACNAMKHAYRGRSDQRIQLVAEAFPDRVAVRLRYLGTPFDPSAVPPPPLDGSRESGFGVFLIAQSVDAVRYYRDDLERSCVYLEKRRPA